MCESIKYKTKKMNNSSTHLGLFQTKHHPKLTCWYLDLNRDKAKYL